MTRAHSVRTDISDSCNRCCSAWWAFEFARDNCSTVAICARAAVRVHQVRSGGSKTETKTYELSKTRTACRKDSGEARKSDLLRLFEVFWSRNSEVPLIRVGSVLMSRLSDAPVTLDKG